MVCIFLAVTIIDSIFWKYRFVGLNCSNALLFDLRKLQIAVFIFLVKEVIQFRGINALHQQCVHKLVSNTRHCRLIVFLQQPTSVVLFDLKMSIKCVVGNSASN
jgi:hypothetical protein